MLYVPSENIDIDEYTGIVYGFRSTGAMDRFLLRLEYSGRYDPCDGYVPILLYIILKYNGLYYYSRTGIGMYLDISPQERYPIIRTTIEDFLAKSGLSGTISLYFGYYERSRYTLVSTIDLNETSKEQIEQVPLHSRQELQDDYFGFDKPSQLYIDTCIRDVRGTFRLSI